jgi:c(7)-type cytochrome triheme protein
MKGAGRGSVNAGGGAQHLPKLLLLLTLLSGSEAVAAGTFWNLPPLPPPQEYGDLLLDRLATANEVKPVFFSHWSHRTRYTCRVCHWELDFAFKVGGTEMTEADNRNGLFCGKCHDGKVAFGHDEGNCQRCHTGKKVANLEKFTELRNQLPRDKYGNGINWAAALRTERIKPLYSIFKPEEKPLEFRKRLMLEAEWAYVPPAYFSHEVHAGWLDCGSCHPDIFKIKKKTTEHFLMQYILEEKFCGVCHLRVAFPMDNCQRCHPALKR